MNKPSKPENEAVDEKIVFEHIKLEGKNKYSIAGENEETDSLFCKAADRYFWRYNSERYPFETQWNVCDYMAKCAQNSAVKEAEEGKGANLSAPLGLDSEPTRANLGSTVLRRAISTMTGQYMAVHLSRETPFTYSPIVNMGVPGSDVETEPEASIYNLYARWTLRRNQDGVTTRDAAHHIYKYGNVAEWCYWRNQKIGKHDVSHTAFKQIPLHNLWADVNHCDLETQNCVITCGPMTIKEILDAVDNKDFDADQVMKLTRRHLWDGQYGHDEVDEKRENKNMDSTSLPADTGFYLAWQVFMWAPIKDGEWKTGNRPKLFWSTIIGNEIKDGILVRLEESRDPDGEIPLHLTPFDVRDEGSLYSISPGEIIRSNYAAECTLKSQVVDEGTNDLLAPDIINASAFPNKRDFTRDGSPWMCDVDPKAAVFRLPGGNASPMALQLIEYLSDDSSSAVNLDRTFRGESFGARTSALEAGNIFRSSAQPILDQIRYSLTSRETWRARKILSYSKYAPTDQIIAITDDYGVGQRIQLTKDADLAYDIEIRIVDDFEDSILKQQALNEAIATLGAVPDFLQHIDVKELLREFLDAKKLKSSKLLIEPMDYDASRIAETENMQMYQDLIYTAPSQGENHRNHLKSHRPFLLKLQGLEDVQSQQAAFLLDQHIKETEAMEVRASAPAPRGQRNQSEGEAAGNSYSALAGAATPQNVR